MRSPFSRALMSAIGAARQDSLPEKREPQRPSRRGFVKAAGLGLLSVPFLGVSRAKPGAKPRVAIVGAGISGLTAALTLADAGIGSTIYEASDRIGGRMHSNIAWADGQVTEWCGEFIDSDHVTIRALTRRFGLTLVDVNAADPSGSLDTNYFQGGYYPSSQVVRDLTPVLNLALQQGAAAGYPTTYNSYNATGYALDHMTAYDWIETYVPGGHASKAGEFLDVAITTEYGLDTSQQSSLNIVFYGHTNERFHIGGGNQQLPTAIAASLPAGTIQTGCTLVKIAVNPDQTIALTFSAAGGIVEASFDQVILALPFSVLRGVDYSQAGFNPLKQSAIASLGYGTNSKLDLQFSQRYWNGRGAWPAKSNGFIESDLAFQTTWDSSRAEPGASGLITDYTGGAPGASFLPSTPYSTAADNSQVAKYAANFLGQLELVWPGISAYYTGVAALSFPTGDPNLLGSYSCWKPGQYTQFAGYERVAQGNVHFAGEHTSVEQQGYMEGGAAEGIRAAKEVLGQL